MKDNYKISLMETLSKLLPPFATSVTKLLIYIQEEKGYHKELLEKAFDVTSQTGEIIESLEQKIKNSRKLLDSGIADMELVKDMELEVYYINRVINDCLRKITYGINNLLFLIAQEHELDVTILKHLRLSEDPPSLSVAVDHLYEGAKNLTEIIDEIIK